MNHVPTDCGMHSPVIDITQEEGASQKDERLRSQQEALPVSRKLAPRMDAAAVCVAWGAGISGQGPWEERRRGESTEGKKISKKPPSLGLHEHKGNTNHKTCLAPFSGSPVC